MKPPRIEPGLGQESVWDYPRPPRVEPTPKRIRVEFAGITIADSVRAQRVLETSHPPVYYIPWDELARDYLIETVQATWCEYKGEATYVTIRVGEREAVGAGWCYRRPTPAFVAIRDHVAFYATKIDRCLVDDETATPQPGGFYGGWVTADIIGPFKGIPGSMGW